MKRRLENQENKNLQPMLAEFGPLQISDSGYIEQVRFHQSWYRARVLKLPHGTGPRKTNKTPYGYMLRWEDGVHGRNFLSHHIFEVAKRRQSAAKGIIDEFSLLCNMLSNQALCFNLFGPLVDQRDLATHFFQVLYPGEIKEVIRMVLAFAPEPANEYLNDRTSLDGLVDYIRPDGEKGLIGIITRLAQPAAEKSFTSQLYRKLTEQEDSPYLQGATEQLADLPLNTIWRHQLLVEAIRRNPKGKYKHGRLMLVYHPADTEFQRVLEMYQSLLKTDSASFSKMALDWLIEQWKLNPKSDVVHDWLDKFQERYLDLSLSQKEFQNYRQAASNNSAAKKQK